MAEENSTNETKEQTPATPPSDETQNTAPSSAQSPIPYDRFKQVNDEKNELKNRLAALEQAEQERQRAKALAEGNYQEIIEKLTPQAQRAEELAQQLKAYQDRDQAELDAELNALDEDMRGLVIATGDPSMQLAWVRNAKRIGLFTKPTPPSTDSGAKGDPKESQPEESEATRRLRELGQNIGFNTKRR